MAIKIIRNRKSKVVDTRYGTLRNIVLQNTETGVCVRGLQITYLESFDSDGEEIERGHPEYLMDVFEEWLEQAENGVEGFDILEAAK